MPAPFVVTGCGHSGTGWAAKLLTTLGPSCGHEQHFVNVEPDGPLERGESSWLALGWPELLPPDLPIVHLIRDPLDVLRSIVRNGFLGDGVHAGTPFARFVRERRPDLWRASGFARQVAWVTRWDDLLDRRARFVLFTDRAGPDEINGLLRFVGSHERHPAMLAELLDELGSDVNAHARDADDSIVSLASIAAMPDGQALLARRMRLGYAP